MTSRSNKYKQALIDSYGEHGKVIYAVLEAHRTSNRYSLRHLDVEIYECIRDYTIETLRECYKIYALDEKGKKKKQVPHPNYFMAVVRNQKKETISKIQSSEGLTDSRNWKVV